MLTVPQAARRTGRNPETIRRWIRSGRLPATKFGTQHVIDEVDLDELVHGVRAWGLAADTTPDHRAFMDDVVRTIRDDRATR